jgi:hypothetical protein
MQTQLLVNSRDQQPKSNRDFLEYESSQTNKISLFKEEKGKFWRAYEQSAHLLINHFWQDIKVNGGYIKAAEAEVYYVGFPDGSLQTKILDRMPEVFGAIITEQSETRVIISVPPIQGFKEWKDSQTLKREQVVEKITPYYGELPIFKKTYDLLNTLLNTTRHFKRDVKYTLGEKIITCGLDINTLVYRLLKAKEKSNAKTPSQNKANIVALDYTQFLLTAEIDEKVETLRLLFRIAYENKLHSPDKHIEFSNSIESIRKQLHSWNKQQAQSEQTYSQTSIMPTTMQERISGIH